MNHVSTEIWKDVIGFEGLYVVSNFGNIRSVRWFSKGAYLKGNVTRDGYSQVLLCKHGKPKMFYRHKIVAAAFIPNTNNYPQINHIDGNKLNNLVENLEWCTRSMNQKHAIRTNLQPLAIGEKNGQSKLTADQVVKIKTVFKNLKGNTVARMFGVTPATIYLIRSRQTWKHV